MRVNSHDVKQLSCWLVGEDLARATVRLDMSQAFAIGLLGCGSPTRQAQPAVARPQRGGAAVATVRSEPRTFNRYAGRDAVSEFISHLTQAKLVRINRVTQDVEPWLAESWAPSPDGLSYTLKLRPGLRFSDGAPFTATDVVFAFDAIYDEKTASPIGDSVRVGGKPLQVRAVDPLTVLVTFPSRFGPGLRLLDNLPILPRHRLDSFLRQGKLASAWSVTTPVSEMAGLGPFVLAHYQPGVRLVFERNPRYWRKDSSGLSLPYLDRLTLEIVPDQNAELLRLQSGQSDFTQSEVRPEDYAPLKRLADAGRLQLLDLGVALDADCLWFNLNGDAANDSNAPWWRRAEFRRAISHAVDRRTFADTVFLGAGLPIYGPITPANRRWFASDAPRTEYDPAQARRLLAAVGLVDRNADGTLEDARQVPVRFTLLTQKGRTARERGAAVIKEALGKIGVAVDVVALEAGTLIQRFTSGRYEAIYFGFNTTDTDPAINLDFWLSTGSAHVWNLGHPEAVTSWERRIDDLMHRQAASAIEADRKRLFDEVQQIFGEHLPAIYFVAPRVYIAMSARLVNAMPAPLVPPILWNPDVLAVRSTGAIPN